MKYLPLFTICFFLIGCSEPEQKTTSHQTSTNTDNKHHASKNDATKTLKSTNDITATHNTIDTTPAQPDRLQKTPPANITHAQATTTNQKLKAKDVAKHTANNMINGEEIYNTYCAACHNSGVLNAPKLGDKNAWQTRAAKGIETLYKHSINGFNAMPARGGSNASDGEIKAAVDYMLSP